MKNNSTPPPPTFDTIAAFKKLAFELSDKIDNSVLKSRLRIMRTRFNKNSLTPDAMNTAIEESNLFKVHTPLKWQMLESKDFTDASIYNREAPASMVKRHKKFANAFKDSKNNKSFIEVEILPSKNKFDISLKEFQKIFERGPVKKSSTKKVLHKKKSKK